MDRYEVIFKNDNGDRWLMMFDADDFAHAEEQAINALEVGSEPDEIIQIVKDYE